MGAQHSQPAVATPIIPPGSPTTTPYGSGDIVHSLSEEDGIEEQGQQEQEDEPEPRVLHTAMLIPELPTDAASMPVPIQSHEDEPLPIDESSPLLPLKMRDSDWKSQAWGGRATASSAVANLTTSIIGVGIIGLPAVVKILGIPLGVFSLLSLGLLSDITVQMLLKHSRFSGFWSYADLLTHTRGKFGRGMMRFSVIAGALGSLVIFMIVIGDVLSGTGAGLHHHFGLLENVWGPGHWMASRPVALATVTLFLLFPLCLFGKIGSLKVTSAISIILAMGSVVVILALAAVAFSQGRCDLGALRWLPAVASWEDLGRLCSALPTIATAYVCHQNVHPIYIELHPPRWDKMRSAARTTFAFSTAVYTLTAVGGYLLFGNEVMGDVLTNFDDTHHLPYGKILGDAVRVSYALHLLLVFPVVHFSLRASLAAAFFPNSPHLVEDRVCCAAMTGVILMTVLAGTLLVTDIRFAFQLTGSLSAVTLAFTLPGLIALSGAAGPVSPAERHVATVAVVLGVLVSLTGVGNACYSIYAHFMW